MPVITRGASGAAVLALLTLSTAGVADAGDGDEVVVVVNARNPSTRITRGQLKSIYLGQTSFWHGVVPMKVVMRPVTSEPSQVFFEDVLGVSAGRYRQNWDAKQLSGQGVAPKEVGSADAVANMVRSNPGAIGFLLASEAWESPPAGVRIIPVQE